MFDHELLVPIPVEVLRAESTAYKAGSKSVVHLRYPPLIPDINYESMKNFFIGDRIGGYGLPYMVV